MYKYCIMTQVWLLCSVDCQKFVSPNENWSCALAYEQYNALRLVHRATTSPQCNPTFCALPIHQGIAEEGLGEDIPHGILDILHKLVQAVNVPIAGRSSETKFRDQSTTNASGRASTRTVFLQSLQNVGLIRLTTRVISKMIWLRSCVIPEITRLEQNYLQNDPARVSVVSFRHETNLRPPYLTILCRQSDDRRSIGNFCEQPLPPRQTEQCSYRFTIILDWCKML